MAPRRACFSRPTRLLFPQQPGGASPARPYFSAVAITPASIRTTPTETHASIVAVTDRLHCISKCKSGHTTPPAPTPPAVAHLYERGLLLSRANQCPPEALRHFQAAQKTRFPADLGAAPHLLASPYHPRPGAGVIS